MAVKERGILVGNTIVLESPVNMPERTEVEVEIVPVRKNVMKAFGLWKERKNLSGLIKEIYTERKKNRGRSRGV